MIIVNCSGVSNEIKKERYKRVRIRGDVKIETEVREERNSKMLHCWLCE